MFKKGIGLLSLEVKYIDQEAKELGLSYGTPGSAGLDLRILGHRGVGKSETYTINPNEQIIINTGVAIHVDDPSYVGMVYVRSSIGIKRGLTLANGTGVIDSDYQGEILVCLRNNTTEPVTLEHGERVAQYVLMPCVKISPCEVKEFSEESHRGVGAMGSTNRDVVKGKLEPEDDKIKLKEAEELAEDQEIQTYRHTKVLEQLEDIPDTKCRRMVITRFEDRDSHNYHYPKEVLKAGCLELIKSRKYILGYLGNPKVSEDDSGVEALNKVHEQKLNDSSVFISEFAIEGDTLTGNVCGITEEVIKAMDEGKEFKFVFRAITEYEEKSNGLKEVFKMNIITFDLASDTLETE